MLNTIKTVVEFLYYAILTCKQLRPHSHHNLAIQKMTKDDVISNFLLSHKTLPGPTPLTSVYNHVSMCVYPCLRFLIYH